jgi:hypothetical protein
MKRPRREPTRGLAAILALGAACCGGAPQFATHACGDTAHPVHMPLSCLEPPELVAGQPDHGGAVARTLAALAARSTGKPAEMMAGLSQEYGRLDRALRADYTAACQRWTTPCDRAQEAAYTGALGELRARNDRLRSLHAAVEDLAQSGRRIELTDEATKSLLGQLETAAEALSPTRAAE